MDNGHDYAWYKQHVDIFLVTLDEKEIYRVKNEPRTGSGTIFRRLRVL